MENKESAISFLQLASSGRVREAFGYVCSGFRHHNPYFASDAETLMGGMEAASKHNPQQEVEVQRVLQDGDFVAVHSRVVPKPGQPMSIAVVHIFRFEGGRIAELWDIAQQVPSESPNANGMF